MATPVGFLALAVLGLAVTLARKMDRLAGLVIFHWIFLLVLRALPHTPGHDGIRQFLPAFGCLALVAGLGVAWAIERWPRFSKAAVLLRLPKASSARSSRCQCLSPTSAPWSAVFRRDTTGYGADVLLGRIDPKLPPLDQRAHEPGRTILFSATPVSYFHLQKSGKLLPGAFPYDSREWQWYILQNRPGSMRELDHLLVARRGSTAVISSYAGVPLIWAFRRSRVRRGHEFIAEPSRCALIDGRLFASRVN